MLVPETHLRQIARWCEAKVPERARELMRFEPAVQGANVTILEARAPRKEEVGPEWIRHPKARLRYDGSSWWLYWPDRDAGWQLDEDVPSAAVSPGALLEVLDNPYGPFWE